MDINQVTLVGRIASEIKFTPKKGDKSARASFVLATNRVKASEADYIPCVVWGKNAENVAKYCKKGKELGLLGHIRTNSVKKAEGEYDNFWNMNATFVSFGHDSKKQSVVDGNTGSDTEGELDMAQLAKKLAAAAKPKPQFDEEALRTELLKAGVPAEQVDGLIAKYKADHGLEQATESAAEADEQDAETAAAEGENEGPF